MEPAIIYEDDSILVLDKPTGWVVNEAITAKNTPVLQTWVKRNYRFAISNSQTFRSGIVHRLDKETSGVLILAKTKKAFKALQGQFKERKVQKTYLALVRGKPELETGIIKVPVGRLPWNKERFGVLPGGRLAETRYKTLRTYVLGSGSANMTTFKATQPTRLNKFEHRYSLLELYPRTGRTHQIRIHLKHIGHPIAADKFYAGRKTARDDRKWCPRLFLHASGISLTHPKTGKIINFKSALPDDLNLCLKKLTQLG